MSKHTPGEWSVHGDNKTLIGCDQRKMMLAEVLWEHVCTEWGRPIEEAQANARLIAAAPDLLEACKWAMGTIRGNHYGLTAAEIAEALEMAAKGCEEAIAKAEGGAS